MLKAALKQLYRGIPMKRQMFETLRQAGIPESLYRHLHFTGPFYVTIDGQRGFMIEHRGTIVENELFWSGMGGSWEGQSNRIWAAVCENRSGIILDIGANTGVYSLIAGAVAHSSATIVAFEPVVRIAQLLRRNIDLNGQRILIEQTAASDSDGSATIYDFAGDVAYSASIERPFPGADIQYEVPIGRADRLLEKYPAGEVTACKIDVEGHEAAVMRGLQQTIAGFQPPILIEILDANAGAGSGSL